MTTKLKPKTYFCQAVINDVRYWGYQDAIEPGLALACFLQDRGFSEDDASYTATDTVDYIRIDRLSEFIPEDFDPWGCETPFELRVVEEVDESDIEEYEADIPFNEMGRVTNRIWHAARVLWLVKNPVYLDDPIAIDNHCHYGHIYPVPEIIDGWHRLYAHRFLGHETIPSLYSGRIDLRDYLTGKTDNLPE